MQEYSPIRFFTLRIYSFLRSLGVSEEWINITAIIVIIAIAIILVTVFKKVTNYSLEKIYSVTKFSIFDHLIKNKISNYLAYILSYVLFVNIVPDLIFKKHISRIILKFADIFFVFVMIWIIMSVIKSLLNVLAERSTLKNRPMKSYIQIIEIILYIFGAVAIFSIVTGKSATVFFTAMGAASAILMLMFKDTIMGFVGSIQISTNRIVLIGDWITMNKYGADGTVEEINLSTVKVRNFDKTITTIPTYSLISDSFQNWRGMQESGGRRVKRSFYVKQRDIKLLSESELDEYEKEPILSEFIKEKRKHYAKINNHLKVNETSKLRGYHITNCDLFLSYINSLLKCNPEIRQDYTCMARQMAPTSSGIPIELYFFTNTVQWIEYERISAEVLNQVYYSLDYFKLEIFEVTAGNDSLNVNLSTTKN